MATKNKRRPKAGQAVRNLTAEWVETMLQEAGAPEPWERPEALQRLADSISLHRMLSHVPKLRLPEAVLDEGRKATRMGMEDRAQAAVDELHRVLPHLINTAEAVAAGPRMRMFGRGGRGPTADLNAEAAAEAGALIRLYSVLVPISSAAKGRALDRPRGTDGASTPKRRSPESASWHRAAVFIFGGYAEVVGHASTSRNANAVRFVAAALFHIFEETVTPAAISQALVRAGVTTRRSVGKSG